jgi:hypothetical protein
LDFVRVFSVIRGWVLEEGKREIHEAHEGIQEMNFKFEI